VLAVGSSKKSLGISTLRLVRGFEGLDQMLEVVANIKANHLETSQHPAISFVCLHRCATPQLVIRNQKSMANIPFSSAEELRLKIEGQGQR
jgi:hypothetical protein